MRQLRREVRVALLAATLLAGREERATAQGGDAPVLESVGAQTVSARESALRARLSTQPGDAEAARDLADLLERSGRQRAGLVWRRRVLAEAASDGTRAQATLDLGVALVEAGQSREAIPLLRLLAAREPANEPAAFELGTALARDEEFAPAFEAFAKAAKLHPKDGEAQLSAAKSLVTLLRYAEAEPYLTAALNLGVSAEEVHGLRGVVCEHTGREQEAIAEFKAALALNPKDAEMQLHLGETLRAMGQVAEAIGPLARSAELSPSVAAYFQLARSYRALGDTEKERTAEERRKQMESDQVAAHRVAALQQDAARAATAKDFAKAAESYRAALTLRPKDADLLYRAALIEGQRHDLAAEQRLLAQALAITPDHAAVLGELGTLEGSQGQTRAAQTHLRRAVELDPQNGVALRNLAVLVAQAGDLRESADLLLRAVESDPTDASSFRSLGLVYAAQGRMAEAERALRTSSELQPGDGATDLAWGQLLLSEGRSKEGIEALRRAALEMPSQVVVHLLLAQALLRAGDVAGAGEQTKLVLDLAPESEQGLALKRQLCGKQGPDAEMPALCGRPTDR